MPRKLMPRIMPKKPVNQSKWGKGRVRAPGAKSGGGGGVKGWSGVKGKGWAGRPGGS